MGNSTETDTAAVFFDLFPTHSLGVYLWRCSLFIALLLGSFLFVFPLVRASFFLFFKLTFFSFPSVCRSHVPMPVSVSRSRRAGG